MKELDQQVNGNAAETDSDLNNLRPADIEQVS